MKKFAVILCATLLHFSTIAQDVRLERTIKEAFQGRNYVHLANPKSVITEQQFWDMILPVDEDIWADTHDVNRNFDSQSIANAFKVVFSEEEIEWYAQERAPILITTIIDHSGVPIYISFSVRDETKISQCSTDKFNALYEELATHLRFIITDFTLPYYYYSFTVKFGDIQAGKALFTKGNRYYEKREFIE